MFGAIAGAVASNLLGNGGQQSAEPPGFHGSGAPNEQNGFATRPQEPITEEKPELEPLIEPRGPVDRFEQLNEKLDTPLGKVGTGVVGGLISDARQRRNTKKNTEYLKSQGLTPWEIHAGGGSGTVQSQGNTLGSGPATQLKAQQDFQAEQKQLDRDLQKYIVDKQTAPQEKQADTSRMMYELQKNLNPLQVRNLQEQNNKLHMEFKKLGQEYEFYWERMFAQMGPDNALMALTMFNQGLPLKDILQASRNATAEEKEKIMQAIEFFTILKSQLGVNALGIKDVVDQMFKGENRLGDQVGPNALNILGKMKNPFADMSMKDYLLKGGFVGHGLRKWRNSSNDSNDRESK